MPQTAEAGPVADAAQFVTALQDEQAALVAFIELLRAEQEALVAGDAERVARLCESKATQIELLGHLGEWRNRHLASQQLAGSAAGMLAWIKRNPGFSAAVGKLWRELLAQAKTAQQLNQCNGALIAGRLQHNRVKLAALQSAAGGDGVYRADGQLLPLRGARYLSRV